MMTGNNTLLFFCLAVLISGCAWVIEQPTYEPYINLFSEKAAVNSVIVEALHKVPAPRIGSAPLACQWYFLPGSSEEGLVTGEVAGNGTAVALPHRIDLADHPMWYKATVRTGEPCVLQIGGDDGVQLFVNGNRVSPIGDNFFRVDASGELKLTIRVLNNAMAGGLRSVAKSPVGAYEAYQGQVKRYLRLMRLAEKASLMRDVSQEHAALVVTALGNSDAVSLERAEAAFADRPMLMGPYVTDEGNNAVTIRCTSDGDAPIELYWGESRNDLGQVQVRPAPHGRFVIDDVPPGRVYFYQLRSGKTRSEIYTIDRVVKSASFSFNVWADSQSGWDAFAANVTQMSKEDDAFGVGVGDLVANGCDAEHWRKFLGILSFSAAERPYYLVAGNHDYDGYYEDLLPENYLKYASRGGKRYFSWTWGNAAFIALDPNANFPIGIPAGSDQHKWFHRQIASDEWKRATWRIVFLHQPPYSQGWAGYHGDMCIRDLLDPIMEKAGIDFVVSGHTHDYERLVKQYGRQRTTMLIVGGGGGPLEPQESSAEPKMDTVVKAHHFGRFMIDGNVITFKALDSKGTLIDSLSFKK